MPGFRTTHSGKNKPLIMPKANLADINTSAPSKGCVVLPAAIRQFYLAQDYNTYLSAFLLAQLPITCHR